MIDVNETDFDTEPGPGGPGIEKANCPECLRISQGSDQRFSPLH